MHDLAIKAVDVASYRTGHHGSSDPGTHARWLTPTQACFERSCVLMSQNWGKLFELDNPYRSFPGVQGTLYGALGRPSTSDESCPLHFFVVDNKGLSDANNGTCVCVTCWKFSLKIVHHHNSLSFIYKRLCFGTAIMWGC